MEEFLAYYDINHDEAKRIDSGLMWILRPCPLDASHGGTSPAVILRDDGTLCWECKHESCQMPWKDFRKALEKLHSEKQKFRFFDKPAAGASQRETKAAHVADAVPARGKEPAALTGANKEVGAGDDRQVQEAVDEIMRDPLDADLGMAAAMAPRGALDLEGDDRGSLIRDEILDTIL